MGKANYRDRIVRDPGICGGEPVLKGTRVTLRTILASLADPHRTYVGSTSDPGRRLAEHNGGKSPHTSKHLPWRMVVAFWFADTRRGAMFERYLKSGSGRAFAVRHLL